MGGGSSELEAGRFLSILNVSIVVEDFHQVEGYVDIACHFLNVSTVVGH